MTDDRVEITFSVPANIADHPGSVATFFMQSLRDSGEWRHDLPEVERIERV